MIKGKLRLQFITLFVLLSLIVFSCNSSKSSSIENVNVKYVSFTFETIVSVPCDNFSTSFPKDAYQYWQPNKKDTLYLLDELVKQFSPVNQLDMDVKGIFEWKENNHSSKYCLTSSEISPTVIHFTKTKNSLTF